MSEIPNRRAKFLSPDDLGLNSSAVLPSLSRKLEVLVAAGEAPANPAAKSSNSEIDLLPEIARDIANKLIKYYEESSSSNARQIGLEAVFDQDKISTFSTRKSLVADRRFKEAARSQEHESLKQQSLKTNALIANLAEELMAQKEEIKALKKKKSGVPSGDTKIHNTVNRILIGMAWAAYGFNPYQTRNKATNSIRDSLLDLDVKVDDQTLLTHLRNAAEALSEDSRLLLQRGREPSRRIR